MKQREGMGEQCPESGNIIGAEKSQLASTISITNKLHLFPKELMFAYAAPNLCLSSGAI